MKSIKQYFTERLNNNQFLNNKQDIINWLNKYNIKNYIINNDLTVDVNDHVDISNNQLTNIPIKFNVVKGFFDCHNNELMTLEGCPKAVYGNFWCSHNQLKTLEGCPKVINGDFDCYSNQLKTLEGCPKEIQGDFYCSYNKLTTLEGCPEVIQGGFYCSNNKLEHNIKAFINIPKDIKYWKVVQQFLNKEQQKELIIKEPDWVPIVSMM